jgi:hypothetical protein
MAGRCAGKSIANRAADCASLGGLPENMAQHRNLGAYNYELRQLGRSFTLIPLGF